MSQSLFLPAILFSCVTFALALGPGAGCTTTPPPTLPSATTELLTERNRIAVTLRMGEALDRLAQQAWEEKRLSTTRYEQLHGQYAVMQQYGTRYAQQTTVDLMPRRQRHDRDNRQVMAQAVMETFQSMLTQAQAWGLVQDIQELEPQDGGR